MSTTAESTDWRLLREFAGVDLEQSFVLSWDIAAETLLVDIDVHLLPDHPSYEKPRPAEKVCIRPADIEFPLCEKISVNRDFDDTDPVSVVRGLGLGAIQGLRRLKSGHYEINGKFGTVLIEAERPVIRLKEL